MGSIFPLSLCLLALSFLVSGFSARYSPTIKPVTSDGPGESLCKALSVLQAAVVGRGQSTGTTSESTDLAFATVESFVCPLTLEISEARGQVMQLEEEVEKLEAEDTDWDYLNPDDHYEMKKALHRANNKLAVAEVRLARLLSSGPELPQAGSYNDEDLVALIQDLEAEYKKVEAEERNWVGQRIPMPKDLNAIGTKLHRTGTKLLVAEARLARLRRPSASLLSLPQWRMKAVTEARRQVLELEQIVQNHEAEERDWVGSQDAEDLTDIKRTLHQFGMKLLVAEARLARLSFTEVLPKADVIEMHVKVLVLERQMQSLAVTEKYTVESTHFKEDKLAFRRDFPKASVDAKRALHQFGEKLIVAQARLQRIGSRGLPCKC